MNRARKSLRVATSLLLVLIMCGNTMAQGTVNEETTATDSLDATIPARLQMAIYSLKPNKNTRIESMSGRQVEAPYRGHTRDSLYLASGESEERVSAAEIDEIWVQGTSAGQGALVGGAICGIALGAMSYAISQDDYFANSHDAGLNTMMGAAMGFAIGAGIGALIGSAIPRWHRKY